MTPSRPEIFISATSSDLSTCRQLVKNALLTLGCTPVEQTNFPPAASSVREMLRKRITDCQAVIHLAGEVYGAEPQERSEDEPRRSYTHMECDIAYELGKPVYFFICSTDFPYDDYLSEDEEQSALQRLHRDKLLGLDALYELITSREQLEKRVYALQIRVEQLIKELEATNNELEETRSNERQLASALADSYMQLQAQLAGLKLTDAEIFNRAITSTAERAGVSVTELKSSINLFVAAVRENPGAEFMDLALADFAERNFSSAARNAALAGDEGEAKLHAANEVAARVKNEVETAEKQIRESRNLEGQALYADKHFTEAVQAFEKALAATFRSEQPETWAELQGRLGQALNELAKVSTGDAIALHRQQAIAAYRAALQVLTREALPQNWAATQNNMANALSYQAMAAEGIKREPLLAEAVEAYRAALQVYTREALPQDWAMTQNNMANVLSDQALAAEGIKRESLLAEAVEAYRAALEVRTREALPQDWAATQNNMATALSDQAQAAEGVKREPLLAQAVEAYRAALQVHTREALPQNWAATQNNMATALRYQAMAAEGIKRELLLAEAVEAYRAALQVYTREALPQDWAVTQNNMANALSGQAQAAEGIERARLLSKAVVAKKAVLEVYTAEFFPERHAKGIDWISEVEAKIRQLTQH